MSQPSFDDIVMLLNEYIIYCTLMESLKQKYKHFRMPNFPSEISENIVKFIIYHKTGHLPTWKTQCGDLVSDGKKIEVKCFASSGPSTFGPTEKWDEIYFLDARDYLKKNFKCYKINMNNIEFGNIHINGAQLYSDQCRQGRRPRITFDTIYKQLGQDKIELMFDANLSTIHFEMKN